VVSEGIDDRGKVSGKDPGVKVKEILKAVHIGSLHKVLPLLQLGQQTILLSQPADQEVLFHCHQLMALTCHAAHLIIWGRHSLLEWEAVKICQKATSSETAASPGETLCKWINGRRNIKAMYCKDA